MTPYRSRTSASQSRPKARSLHISSTNRTPALTKNETRATTSPKRSAGTCPESRTASSTAIAVHSAYATSWTGVAPASCRWYEQMLIGFHFGSVVTAHATVSVVSRSDGPGGKTYVPRERYSFTMSFCVVPASAVRSAPCSSATVT